MEATKLMSAIKRIPLGDVIAERVLAATNEGNSYVATVRLGRPVRMEDAPGYLCPYQVSGIGDDVVRSAGGEDSMQALDLAIKTLGAELHLRYRDFTFTWLGQADLGFPKPKI